jgi:hypothetical protein
LAQRTAAAGHKAAGFLGECVLIEGQEEFGTRDASGSVVGVVGLAKQALGRADWMATVTNSNDVLDGHVP